VYSLHKIPFLIVLLLEYIDLLLCDEHVILDFNVVQLHSVSLQIYMN
jgi:hypothetical protein